MFRFYKVVGNNLEDFTDYCGEVNIRSNINEISEDLTITLKLKDYIKEPDIIRVYENERMIFEGETVNTKTDNEYSQTIKAFDFGFFLNKNEEVYQFNSTVSECIKRICTDFDIPVGDIISIPTQIKEIKNGSLSQMIKEMLETAEKEQGKHYVWEFYEGKFWVEERRTVAYKYMTKEFGNYEYIANYLNEPSVETSIEDMINSVKVVQSEENDVKTILVKSDDNNINSFGKMQKIESVSKEDISKASTIAENILKEKNKITKKISVNLVGHIDCKAGKLMYFEDDFINDKRNFLITSCTHVINSVSHTMKLELEVI